MKLIRFGEKGIEKPGVILPDGKKVDASAFGEDYTQNFFASNGLTRLEKWLENYGASCPAVEDSERLGAPLFRPSKIVCIGLNYAKHDTSN